jgi:hypothetical protein
MVTYALLQQRVVTTCAVASTLGSGSTAPWTVIVAQYTVYLLAGQRFDTETIAEPLTLTAK